MSAFIDITGHRFGKLVAVRCTHNHINKSLIWECKCDCGNTVFISRGNLYKSRSCGCSHIEQARKMGKAKRKAEGYSARNKLMRKYEAHARYRNLEFNLSSNQFNNLTKQTCYYCGKEPFQVVNLRGCNGTYTYNGIDRLDNTRGYTIDNCVPCCGTCNKAKMKMSVNEFADWIRRVYRNFAVFTPTGVFMEMRELGIPS